MGSRKDDEHSRRDFLKRILPATALLANESGECNRERLSQRDILIKTAHYISDNTFIIEGTGAGRYAYAYDLALILSGHPPEELYKPVKLDAATRVLMNECCAHIKTITDNKFSATHDADITRFADFLQGRLEASTPGWVERQRIIDRMVDMICLSAAQKGLENIVGDGAHSFWYPQIAQVAIPIKAILFGRKN